MDLITDLKALLAKYQQRDDNFSIDEFCQVENISRPTFKRLQKLGLAPETRRLPGFALLRITKEARAEWRKRMDELVLAEAQSPTPEQKAKQQRWLEAAERW